MKSYISQKSHFQIPNVVGFYQKQDHCFLSFFVSIVFFPRYSILFLCRDINQTSCESRGCCYQELNLEYNGPVCHRKIPSLHSMRVVESNETSADLEYSHPHNLQSWPFTNLTQSRSQRYKYRIQRLAPHHIEIQIEQSDEVTRPKLI